MINQISLLRIVNILVRLELLIITDKVLIYKLLEGLMILRAAAHIDIKTYFEVK